MPKLTLDGLLNALDGAVATEGRIVIMTTNHKTKLDPALVRPGRVEVNVELTFAQREQIERMYLYHCRDAFQQLAGAEEKARARACAFADKLPTRCLTGAQLQAYFMDCRGDPDTMDRNISELLNGMDVYSPDGFLRTELTRAPLHRGGTAWT